VSVAIARVTTSATDDDVRAIAAIDDASFPQTRPAEEHVREELSRPWTRVWAAREGDQITGYLLAWHVADEIHVLQVASRLTHRRRGIGLALVAEAFAYARAEHARLLLLEVRRSNAAAIALYRRVGFVATHVRRGYYADGEDAVEMQAELDPETGAQVARVDEEGLDV
jgi:ribosomal-protein-alanine N-acetyltransferase